MRQYWPRILIVALFALILGIPFALRPRNAASATDAPGNAKLIVYTPNNEQIRYEFSRAFNDYRRSRHLPQVTFDWRASGGTSDLIKEVLSQLKANAQRGDEDQGVGADLFFGGGAYNHHKLARGITIQRHGKPLRVSATVPIKLPAGLLKAAFPSPTIGGEPLYDPHLHWVGTALSSFGIIYNRDVLEMLKLPAPRTWSDLTSPRYQRWIILADPAHSGSIAATYDIILQREGWGPGWSLLRRVFANSRAFTADSAKVPVDVSSGDAAAGMCIDFYGRFQAGAVGHHRVGYIDPPGMTAITADPISLLRGAPHKKLAEQFIAWLLSKPAQALWQKKRHTPGGPSRYELRRQPVRRDIYTAKQKQLWTDPQIDPFDQATSLPRGMPDYFLLVSPLTHAMAIDIHSQLASAWHAICSVPQADPIRSKLLATFSAMPDDLTIHWPDDLKKRWPHAMKDPADPDHLRVMELIQDFWHNQTQRFGRDADPDRLLRAQARWTDFFRKHYEKVITLARGHETG